MIADSGSFPIWLRDDTGRLSYVNQAYAAAVESTPADAVARGIELLDQGTRQAESTLYNGEYFIQKIAVQNSTNPARIIRKPLGALKPGAIADVTIFDPAAEWIYDVRQTRSKSRNSPFDGTSLKGRVAVTLVSGRIAYKNPAVMK